MIFHREVRMTKEKTIYTGVGRRKSAIARVTLTAGKGNINVIDWKMPESANAYILQALTSADKKDKFDIDIRVIGGGLSSRLDAIRLGIARALLKSDPDLKVVLRKAELLTRDYREKERKKPGLRRARRAPQWAKR